jgi:hypothetical protein
MENVVKRKKLFEKIERMGELEGERNEEREG